ncbi:MAG: YigZ family protein, partial [Eubacterium sp.]|nr:YigZ family protein [Eubacterium sp.]
MSEKIIKLLESGESEVIVKKSRFIGITYPVNTPEEAADFVNSIKKKYYDARHNCYAYVIGDNRDQIKFSDDGEPGGTAGKPMLDVLLGSGITNIAVVVTRYFGGTLLGTGGLVRAYSDAAKEAVQASKTYTVERKIRYKIETDYTSFQGLERLFKSK